MSEYLNKEDVLEKINSVGGVDGSDEYDKGWDAAVGAVYEAVAGMEPEKRKIHRLKILKEFADAVVTGEKKFEIRENDRGFQKGDIVIFKAIENGFEVNHPINTKSYIITYVLNGWGLMNGNVAFSIEIVEKGGAE